MIGFDDFLFGIIVVCGIGIVIIFLDILWTECIKDKKK